MSAPLLFTRLAQYYDLIYSFKDYQKESEEIIDLIRKFKRATGNQLLDVACGTGKHLKYLVEHFDCMGLDTNPEMLKIAESHFPNTPFLTANMIDMHLNKQFDVILCLFSSIGYVKTYTNLTKTWQSFADHLNPGGIVIVEPWFSAENFKVGLPFMTTYDSENIKIARLNVSEVKDNVSILNFHYLIAKKNQPVIHLEDRHELGLFDVDKTLTIIQNAGLKAQYIKRNPNDERGLYIGLK
jgi:trans-aconitate methyltransferase